MNTAQRTGRVIGALLLAQMVGLTAGFAILKPAVEPDYLGQAAGMATAIRIAVILLMANGAIALGIGIVAHVKLREHGPRLAASLVAMSVVWLAMQLVDNMHILSMLSLSQRPTESGGANADLYNVLGEQVRSTRVLAHYTELLVIDVWFAIFYGALFLYRMVSRFISAIGLVTVALHLGGIPLSKFIGYPTVLPLAYGLGISYLLIGGWLLAKGFPERDMVEA